jgi:hypothetical protein
MLMGRWITNEDNNDESDPLKIHHKGYMTLWDAQVERCGRKKFQGDMAEAKKNY